MLGKRARGPAPEQVKKALPAFFAQKQWHSPPSGTPQLKVPLAPAHLQTSSLKFFKFSLPSTVAHINFLSRSLLNIRKPVQFNNKTDLLLEPQDQPELQGGRWLVVSWVPGLI